MFRIVTDEHPEASGDRVLAEGLEGEPAARGRLDGRGRVSGARYASQALRLAIEHARRTPGAAGCTRSEDRQPALERRLPQGGMTLLGEFDFDTRRGIRSVSNDWASSCSPANGGHLPFIYAVAG
jgi:hypothetical protein